MLLIFGYHCLIKINVRFIETSVSDKFIFKSLTFGYPLLIK